MNLIHTTIGELYDSLSILEIKQLDNYIKLNGNDKTYKLHKLMVKIVKQNNLVDKDYEFVKKKLYKSTPVNHSSFTTIVNLLITEIKEYLLMTKIKERNIYTETLWGEILIERRLSRNLKIKIKMSKVDYLKDQYSLLKEYYNDREQFVLSYQNLTKKSIGSMILNSIAELNSFENYVLFTRIEVYMSLFSKVKMYKSKIEIPNIDNLPILIEEGLNSKNEVINLYSNILNLYMNGNEKNYLILKEKFIAIFDKLSQDLINLITPVLINFGQSQVNLGLEGYTIYNYELYKFLYHKHLLFSKSNFSYVRFYNFINLEMNLGSVDLAEEVLEKYKTMISNEQRNSFYNLNKAKILFKKREYNSSISLLFTTSKMELIIFIPLVKTTLIKCLIMLEDIDRLTAERDNFYKYINNNADTMPDDAQRRHKLFIKHAAYMIESRYEYLQDYIRRRVEIALLQTSPYFTEKEWMRERWNELKAKYDKKEEE